MMQPAATCNPYLRLLASVSLILMAVAALLSAQPTHAQSQPECINQDAPAPLEICVNATGRHNVWLSDSGTRMPQYFGHSTYRSDWYVRARSNGQTRRFSGGYIHNNQTDLPTEPSSTQLIGSGTAIDPYIIQASLTLGDTGLHLTQQFIYVNGQRSFRKRWRLQNVGSQAATELNFFHGGDIDLGGSNTSRSWRDDSTGMLYATNQDTTTAGYMGTIPHPSTPPSHYYAGQYTQGHSAILSGNLPNTVNNDLTDAGYFLQWQRGALQPGQEWIIEAVEMFSDPERYFVHLTRRTGLHHHHRHRQWPDHQRPHSGGSTGHPPLDHAACPPWVCRCHPHQSNPGHFHQRR